MKQKVLISFSGGRTSAYMTNWLLNNKHDEYEMVVVFANTGREREETLEFVRDCDLYLGFKTVWVEAIVQHGRKSGSYHQIVNFETAARLGEPFEEVIKKYGIPNVQFLHCTREMKANPIRHYARSIGWKKADYVTAIGIRVDEVDRISKGKFIYPLVKLGVNKVIVNDFWTQQFFNLRLKEYEGNCADCFKKSLRKLIQIQRDRVTGIVQPDDWGERMEQRYETFIPSTQIRRRKAPIRFNRKELSYVEIRELSLLSDAEILKKMKARKIELDLSNGCTESCEPFNER